MATVLDILREARPVAVPVEDVWLHVTSVGPSSAHAQVLDARAAGHRISGLPHEYRGKKGWAWRLDFDKDRGR